MVLYMIGLGLGDEDDITVKGLKIIQSADYIFLEAYTSILGGVCSYSSNDNNVSNSIVVSTKERLENAYNITKTSIVIADRYLVENDAEIKILEPARTHTVVFLVVGDPVCATTHTDLWIRATKLNIPVQTIHNASIMSAVGSCGLQLYTFGQTISIPYFTEQWKPMKSFYERILYNRNGNLHTLCLLDIQVKEPDYNKMIQNGHSPENPIYLPPRFMSVAIACQQLIETQQVLQGTAYDVDKTLCIGLARMGNTAFYKNSLQEEDDSSDQNQTIVATTAKRQSQEIVAGTLVELSNYDLGDPLHSLIICADTLHELEWDMVQQYVLKDSIYKSQIRPNIV
jgi:diphthine methyl ester synthase